ncbi:MAG: ferredoxin reductase family protein [Brevirhabdus sp.]
MRSTGLILVVFLNLLPLIWFWPLTAKYDPIALFSQYLGAAALISMAITQVLATRMRGLELIFGGLDRIYILHKWLGISALVMVLLHDTIDADIDGLGRETLLTEIAETLGEISLYAFLALALLTIATFVPYHLWKLTHKFMGAFFAASMFHFAFILKPFALSDPLGVYLLVTCGIGVLAYAVTLLPLGRWHGYVVEALTPTGDAVEIRLRPARRGFAHRAGQFAFVSFEAQGLSEPHPFTLSSAARDDGTLSFTVKPLGDYTAKLARELAVGTRASVSRPFGHFKGSKRRQVWIAAGIGITPFRALAQAHGADAPQTTLLYATRARDTAPHLAEIEKDAAALANFSMQLFASSEGNRLAASDVIEAAGGALDGVDVLYCGPEGLRRSLLAELTAAGLPTRRFHFEEFEIRSGLGLRRLLGWAMPKLKARLSG